MFLMLLLYIYYIIMLLAETVQELRICLQHAIDAMRSTETPVTAIASGSELFLRFITLATLDTPVRILIFRFLVLFTPLLYTNKIFINSKIHSSFNICFHYENLSTLLMSVYF